MPAPALSHLLRLITVSMHRQLFYHVLLCLRSSMHRMLLRIIYSPIRFLFLLLLLSVLLNHLLVQVLSVMLQSPLFVFPIALPGRPLAGPPAILVHWLTSLLLPPPVRWMNR